MPTYNITRKPQLFRTLESGNWKCQIMMRLTSNIDQTKARTKV